MTRRICTILSKTTRKICAKFFFSGIRTEEKTLVHYNLHWKAMNSASIKKWIVLLVLFS